MAAIARKARRQQSVDCVFNSYLRERRLLTGTIDVPCFDRCRFRKPLSDA
jgi:hypothetical protein